MPIRIAFPDTTPAPKSAPIAHLFSSWSSRNQTSPAQTSFLGAQLSWSSYSCRWLPITKSIIIPILQSLAAGQLGTSFTHPILCLDGISRGTSRSGQLQLENKRFLYLIAPIVLALTPRPRQLRRHYNHHAQSLELNHRFVGIRQRPLV